MLIQQIEKKESEQSIQPVMELSIGIKGHHEQVVTPEMSAARVGSGLVDVFATPMMVALMEYTCNESVVPFLGDGEGTVGTQVNISHTAATPIGMKVWCDSELMEIDRRKLLFKVKAFDESGIIGEGTHERFVINMNRFEAKAKEKQQTLGK